MSAVATRNDEAKLHTKCMSVLIGSGDSCMAHARQFAKRMYELNLIRMPLRSSSVNPFCCLCFSFGLQAFIKKRRFKSFWQDLGSYVMRTKPLHNYFPLILQKNMGSSFVRCRHPFVNYFGQGLSEVQSQRLSN